MNGLELYDEYFIKIIKDLKLFCENKEDYYKQLNKEYSENYENQAKELEKIIKYFKLLLDNNYDDCIEIAYNEYISKYNNDILQMLADHSIDSLNENGSKFWSGYKREPIPLPFDSKNELIILYIKKYADILGNSLSINTNFNDDYIVNKCKSIKIKEFVPNEKVIKKKIDIY